MKITLLLSLAFYLATVTAFSQTVLDETGVSYFRNSSSSSGWTGLTKVTLGATAAQTTGFMLSYEADSNPRVGRLTLNNNYGGIFGDFAISLRNGSGIFERFRIKSNGHVGIGTSNPTHQIEVHSGPSSSVAPMFSMSSSDQGLTGVNTSLILRNSDLTNNNWSRMHFFNGNNEGGATIATQFRDHNSSSMTADLVFVTKGNGSYSEKLRIVGNGNVGIGVVNPANKLEVNGTLRAEKIICDPDAWADFVFDADYELMPLANVEQYIHSHRHLPEIPTTAEVTQNGIELGEINAKLLQKVEELTLYLIEQNRQNQRQQEKIEALEAKLDALIEQ